MGMAGGKKKGAKGSMPSMPKMSAAEMAMMEELFGGDDLDDDILAKMMEAELKKGKPKPKAS